MEEDEKEYDVFVYFPSELQRLSTIQDFNNKRAIAHAGFLIASMFGLFTILSLMTRCIDRVPFSSIVFDCNFWRFLLLTTTYWLIWIFGFYSMHNFFYYAIVSQHAEHKIVGDLERRIVEKGKKSRKGS